MNALLLAAGLGTRLRPLTFHSAKASLPLLNVPFLKYPLQYLHSQKMDHAVINLHAHPDSVRSICGSNYEGIAIEYSHEPEILGTAGAIRKASHLLGEEAFAVLNGDMLMDIPLTEVLVQHRNTDADVTLVISPAEKFPGYSSLHFDESSTPPFWLGPQTDAGRKFHYCGLQIVSRRVVPLIPEERKTAVFRDIYPQMAPSRKILGFIYDGMWMEIGNLHEYLETSLQLLRHPLPGHLQPPGMNGLLSPDAIIEPDAKVSESIVMRGAKIKSGITIERCIIGQDVVVDRSVQHVALSRGILPWYFS